MTERTLVVVVVDGSVVLAAGVEDRIGLAAAKLGEKTTRPMITIGPVFDSISRLKCGHRHNSDDVIGLRLITPVDDAALLLLAKHGRRRCRPIDTIL